MKIFPKDEWGLVNGTLVGFGQSICKAKNPLCGECPINKLCEADENFTKKESKKIKKVQIEDDEMAELVEESSDDSDWENKKDNKKIKMKSK